MGDLMNDPRALANTLIRLQKAESRLSDYISNFPGIFFTQRPDMTFSYLSRGIKKLFPTEHTELARDGGLFLSKIFEKDREHFHKELNTNGKIRETFSFTYRISIPPSDQIIYLLDVRTPIITATNNAKEAIENSDADIRINQLQLSILIHAANIGFMVMFSAVVAPTVFKVLSQKAAGAYLRKLFPRMFMFGFITSSCAALAALSYGSALKTLFSRRRFRAVAPFPPPYLIKTHISYLEINWLFRAPSAQVRMVQAGVGQRTVFSANVTEIRVL